MCSLAMAIGSKPMGAGTGGGQKVRTASARKSVVPGGKCTERLDTVGALVARRAWYELEKLG